MNRTSAVLAALLVLGLAGSAQAGVSYWNFYDGSLAADEGTALLDALPGTAYSFVADNIGGVDTTVLAFPGSLGTGFGIDPAGLVGFDAYTVIFDVKLPKTGRWTGLLNADSATQADWCEWYHDASGDLGDMWATDYMGNPNAMDIDGEAWRRFALTYDGSLGADKIKVYVDGQLFDTEDGVMPIGSAGDNAFSVLGDSGFHSNGRVSAILFDDVVYDADSMANLAGAEAAGFSGKVLPAAQPIAEPSALGMIGLALLGLRKRR